ncbi:hypothetical protein Acr_11g0003310 [Actinidia rufa]|uniref:Uncharacterized protein n=1 Tax=Actinidia rufa TaxID=165716 RepID=A0A7J0FBI2_9ERIC|nr:hypothetical protein Acr_11g0003130 [Actinidia rufa]GFY96025.1 hypothetical protein Acr_11g0003310 [Actinidia rufa]
MSHKVHSQGAVPFSWENKPGVSKVAHKDWANWPVKTQKLPPPPCPLESARASFHELQVPLPPCGFQPPRKITSKKGLKKQDDPFLTAYRECTKSTRKGTLGGDSKDDVGFGLRKGVSVFSCKHSCSVRDESMVRISRLPN